VDFAGGLQLSVETSVNGEWLRATRPKVVRDRGAGLALLGGPSTSPLDPNGEDMRKSHGLASIAEGGALCTTRVAAAMSFVRFELRVQAHMPQTLTVCRH
jgi:hypothetical protein